MRSKMKNESEEPDKLADIWMIRPCEFYWDEFKECSGMKGRFHQLYTTGERLDCSKWKQDYNNCVAFQRRDSAADAEKVMENERERRRARLAAARCNDTWQYRTVAPDSFSRPLPEQLLRNAVPNQPNESSSDSSSRCAIS